MTKRYKLKMIHCLNISFCSNLSSHFFQIFGLYATFWPLKSLAFKCPSHFESRVTLKGPLDATRALSKIKITPSASWPFQLLGRPFWPYWPWNSKIWKSCNKRILKNPKMWKNYKLLLFFTFWPLIWPSQPSSAFYIFLNFLMPKKASGMPKSLF